MTQALRTILKTAAHKLLAEVLAADAGPDRPTTEIIWTPEYELTVTISPMRYTTATAADLPEVRELVETALSKIEPPAVSLPAGLNEVERAALAAAGQEPVPLKQLARKAGYAASTYFSAAVRGLVRRGLLRRTPDGIGLP